MSLMALWPSLYSANKEGLGCLDDVLMLVIHGYLISECKFDYMISSSAGTSLSTGRYELGLWKISSKYTFIYEFDSMKYIVLANALDGCVAVTLTNESTLQSRSMVVRPEAETWLNMEVVQFSGMKIFCARMSVELSVPEEMFNIGWKFTYSSLSSSLRTNDDIMIAIIHSILISSENFQVIDTEKWVTTKMKVLRGTLATDFKETESNYIIYYVCGDTPYRLLANIYDGILEVTLLNLLCHAMGVVSLKSDKYVKILSDDIKSMIERPKAAVLFQRCRNDLIRKAVSKDVSLSEFSNSTTSRGNINSSQPSNNRLIRLYANIRDDPRYTSWSPLILLILVIAFIGSSIGLIVTSF